MAAGFDINLLLAGRIDDVLRAEGRVVSQGRRTGVYDVQVLNQRDEVLAVFRGRSHRLQGKQVAP